MQLGGFVAGDGALVDANTRGARPGWPPASTLMENTEYVDPGAAAQRRGSSSVPGQQGTVEQHEITQTLSNECVGHTQAVTAERERRCGREPNTA